MHSASMSRFEAVCSPANVGIGSKLSRGRTSNPHELNRRLKECLKRHGEVDLITCGNRRVRAKILWFKMRAGKIKDEVVPLLWRDYGKMFRQFEKEAKQAA